jgi:choline/glycine/proline betaine transport protein
MGVGLLFFGVAEPVQHYALPPLDEGRTIAAARDALPLTFFHWGLHAWAVYIVVGLSLAYFAFRRGLPPTIRSALFMCYGLLRALRMEGQSSSIDLSIAVEAASYEPPDMTWQQRLDSITRHHAMREIVDFLGDTACSALTEVAEQMRGNGLTAELERHGDHLLLSIPHGEQGGFRYTIRARGFRAPSFAYAETRKVHGTERQHYRAMAHTSEGDQPHDVTGFTRDQLINDLLNRYARFRHTRRLA